MITYMMSVSRQVDYATRIVLHLACQEEGAMVSIPDVSASRHLPVPFVRRIVSRLAETGIVKSVRGPKGGILLGRPAADISLLDVLVAVEGPLRLSDCVEAPKGCPLSSRCPVNGVWASTTHLLDNHLRSVRFHELAQDEFHRQAHRNIHRSPGRQRQLSAPPERRLFTETCGRILDGNCLTATIQGGLSSGS
ncbi:MAG: Rrf2 family transcriptional regulator [Fibrobacterota bacterium]|nr:Rrf2 family transcriptional regulator [Fibrobacterota bacterium]QQS05947.1 MAG: Rrf2 family transcriptional regulator [Fibrobacterota bacterium]